MKRICQAGLVLLLCAAMIVGASPAKAVMARFWPIGDADRDYELTISDVTRIQRLLVGFGAITELDEALGDADGSGAMDIIDATCLQRYLVGLPCAYRYRELTDYHVGDTARHSSAEIAAPGADGSRQIAYVGVPVTFTAEIKWSNPPQRFIVSIDGAVMEERAANGERRCSYTHTFREEGSYEVALELRCKYGVSRSFRTRVDVRSLPADGSPVVMGAAFFDRSWMSSGNDDLTVIAAGGTGPYEYNYTVYYAAAPVEFSAAEAAEDEAEGGEPIMKPEKAFTTGYIAQDTINPPQLLARPAGVSDDLYVRVTVRDAKGRESAPVTVVCYQYQIYL